MKRMGCQVPDSRGAPASPGTLGSGEFRRCNCCQAKGAALPLPAQCYKTDYGGRYTHHASPPHMWLPGDSPVSLLTFIPGLFLLYKGFVSPPWIRLVLLPWWDVSCRILPPFDPCSLGASCSLGILSPPFVPPRIAPALQSWRLCRAARCGDLPLSQLNNRSGRGAPPGPSSSGSHDSRLCGEAASLWSQQAFAAAKTGSLSICPARTRVPEWSCYKKFEYQIPREKSFPEKQQTVLVFIIYQAQPAMKNKIYSKETS